MAGIALRESIPEEPPWEREIAFLVILVTASWVFVWVGTRVAPAHNKEVAVLLAVVVTAAAAKFCGVSATGLLETAAAGASAVAAAWRCFRRPKPGFDRRASWLLLIASSIPGLLFLPFVAGTSGPKRDHSPRGTPALLKTYAKDGVSFSYHDNWSVRPGFFRTDRARQVSLVTGNASLTIAQFRPPVEASLDDYRQILSADILLVRERSHHSGMSVKQIAGDTQAGRVEDLDVSVAGLETPWKRLIFRIGRPDRTVFIIAEAPLAEWSGFEAEIDTILRSLRFY
jgi:hypothetical protein